MTTDLAWVDDIDHERLLLELAARGTDVTQLAGQAVSPREPAAAFQLMPIERCWLRVEQDEQGRMWMRQVPDARQADVDDGSPRVRFDDDSDDLDGWMVTRSDMDGSGRRWLSVIRRPEREAYVALLYDATSDRPQRALMVPGVYPDISLVQQGTKLIFVEPDRQVPGGQRAIVALADPERFEASRTVVAESTSGGIALRPCSVRRYVKMSRGVRSERVWYLVDVQGPRPLPIMVPGTPRDPDLFDVALLDGEPVVVQLLNGDGAWTLQTSTLRRGRLRHTWVCATGVGRAQEISPATGHVVVRVSNDGTESLHRIEIAGFSSGREPLLGSPGLLDLHCNRVTPSIGLAATEMASGMMPYLWYFDRDGVCCNDPAEVAARADRLARSARERCTSDDGYVFDIDLRWPVAAEGQFTGPVVLMLYGAYGMDIPLDQDPQLGYWLQRGYAVTTAHVRGGGPQQRHLAGTRAKRDRSVQDAAAAVRYLRGGRGALRATHRLTLGASAGGFLSAATLNACPDEVDVCVVVNGFVDPITSLIRGDSKTVASDRDEWGDPAQNPNDLAILQQISPVHNLRRPLRAEALVVVSGCDVRVNPRQGLKWALRYRELGGSVDLWYDPNGAHDCWGDGMPETAMVDWVEAALARIIARETSAAQTPVAASA